MDHKEFLQANKNQMIDFVESLRRQLSEGLLGALQLQLKEEFRLNHPGNPPHLDKAHVELSIAMLEAMWCGWLSQAKANRGVYTQEYVDGFKKAIIDAFEIGQEYSKERR